MHRDQHRLAGLSEPAAPQSVVVGLPAWFPPRCALDREQLLDVDADAGRGEDQAWSGVVVVVVAQASGAAEDRTPLGSGSRLDGYDVSDDIEDMLERQG